MCTKDLWRAVDGTIMRRTNRSITCYLDLWLTCTPRSAINQPVSKPKKDKMKAYSTVIFPILLAITVCACQPSVGTGPILPPKEQTNTPSVQSGCASLAPETTDFNFEGLKAEIDSIGTTVGGGGFQKSVTSVYNVSEPYTKCIQHETFRYILDKDPIPMEALCFVNSADQSSFEFGFS